MLVQTILDFISDVKKLGNLTQDDKDLCMAMVAYFPNKRAKETIAKADIVFLKECFKKRWEAVLISRTDYLLDRSPVNERWKEFAKVVASSFGEKYWKILMPSIKNSLDHNNFAVLIPDKTNEKKTETIKKIRFDGLYLGANNDILYSVTGLMDHWEKHPLLSTNEQTTLRALTVEELTRLEMSKSTIISEKKSDVFWTYLQEDVFPKLKSERALDLRVLSAVLKLMETARVLKERQTGKSLVEFQLLKKNVRNFFNILYKMPLDKIKDFYGVELEYKGKKHYLVELLIIINKAQSFDIVDTCFEALTKKFKKEFGKILDAEKKLNVLLTLSLSFFVMGFNPVPFYDDKAIAWDLTHDVPTPVGNAHAALYDRLLKINKTIATNDDIAKIFSTYNEMQRILALHKPTGMVWLLTYPFSGATDCWFEHAAKGSFKAMGACWFKPELLMHALWPLQSPETSKLSSETIIKMNKFLDDLICTYWQPKKLGVEIDSLKELRVNILFGRLIKQLPEADRTSIENTVKLCEKAELGWDIKTEFLNNCRSHIQCQLEKKVKNERVKKSSSFFAEPYICPRFDATDFKSLIDRYSDYIFNELACGVTLKNGLQSYINSLKEPILSYKEDKANKDNSSKQMSAPGFY